MLPGEAFEEMCCGARFAAADAWHQTFSRFGANPTEVHHVFEFVRFATPGLVSLWGPVLAGRGMAVRVTGVFCHQTPKAHYRNGPNVCRPELADLLIVHEHQWQSQNPGGEPQRQRQAVLVQAKMTDDGVCKGRDPVQEYLYQQWPDFELVGRGSGSSSFLKGTRDLKPNPTGSRYGLIAKDLHAHHRAHSPYPFPFCCGFPWWFADPLDQARTAGAEDAGAFIANMLFSSLAERGRSAAIPARPLQLQSSPNNHFDVTVEELLTVTAAKTLHYKDRRVAGTRGRSGVACFQQSHGPSSLLPVTGGDFHASDGDGDDPPDALMFDDEFDGIPLLLIETGGERGPEREEG